MYILEDLIGLWRRKGLVNFCKWMGCQFLFRALRWETILFFRKDLVSKTGALDIPIPVVFKKIRPAELTKRILRQKALGSIIGNDFPAGCDCVVGEFKNKIIYFAWVNYQRIFDRRLMNFRLPQKTAYIYRVYTLPGFRGKGIARAGYLFISNFLAEKQLRHCFVAVSFVNLPSIQSIKNAGFRRIARLFLMNFPHQRVLIFENVSRRLGQVRGNNF